MPVTTGRDDDALSWDGDDDPTLDVGAKSVEPDPAATAPAALPDGFDAVGKGSDAVGRLRADGTVAMPTEPAPVGNATLIALGVFGGVYLLYAIGWLIGGLRLQDVALFVVSPMAYVPTFALAVASPIVWFAAVYLLTRDRKPWLRIAWFLAGAALLVPWPFIMVGAVGAVGR